MFSAIFKDLFGSTAPAKTQQHLAYGVECASGTYISLAYAPCVVMTPGEMNGQRLKAQLLGHDASHGGR